MKIIKYKLCTKINIETDDGLITEDVFTNKSIMCAEDNLDKNIDIAKSEAYNGEYTVEEAPDETYL